MLKILIFSEEHIILTLKLVHIALITLLSFNLNEIPYNQIFQYSHFIHIFLRITRFIIHRCSLISRAHTAITTWSPVSRRFLLSCKRFNKTRAILFVSYYFAESVVSHSEVQILFLYLIYKCNKWSMHTEIPILASKFVGNMRTQETGI